MNMKILLIDDEPDTLLHMTKVLQRQGHTCDQYTDPVAALNVAGESQYDLVISDVVMPAMNGFAVAAKLNHVSPKTRVILVSGHLTQTMEERTREGSPLICMKKPIDVRVLKTVLDQMGGTESASKNKKGGI